jgi:flagellar hook-length control protein FliK
MPVDERPQDAQSQVVALAQAVTPPVLVSTRTDDGSAKQGAVTLSRNSGDAAPAVNPNPVPNAPARVIQVLASQQPEGIVAKAASPALQGAPAPAAPRPQGAVPVPTGTVAQPPQAAQPQGAAPQTPATPASARVQGPQNAPVPSIPQQAPAGEKGFGLPNTAPPSGAAKQAETPAGPSATPVKALDYQVLDPKGAVPVQAGSEVTLKEDGTWVLPKADTSNAKQSAPAQNNGTPLSPANEAAAAKPFNPTAPLNVTANTTQQAAPSAPANVNAATPAAPPSTTVAPAMLQTPAAASVPVQAPPADPKAAAAPKSEAAESTVHAPKPQEEAIVPAARRQAQDGVFNGLGRQAQDPVTALALQAARDYSVRESVFKQVSEALREAPDKESGRLLIRLKPAELGEVTVDLILKDGKLSARLVASQGEVRDAFVRDLQSFKAGLESQGVVVRDVSVAVRAGVADQQQQPAPQQQAPWWRDLPPQNSTPVLSQPALAGFASGATDNRFSALA